MKHVLQLSSLQYLIKHRNAYLGLALLSLLLNLVLGVALTKTIGHERIILVPPTINQSFWVEHNHISPEYLAQISTFFIGLRFNIAPNSAKQQREALLRLVDPSIYETLKNQLLAEEERLNKDHVSMVFYPIATKINQKKLQALITGDLTTIVGTSVIAPKHVTYQITYRYHNGRLLVKALEEVKKNG